VPGEATDERNGPDNCRYCDYDRVCAANRLETWERKQGAVVEILP